MDKKKILLYPLFLIIIGCASKQPSPTMPETSNSNIEIQLAETANAASKSLAKLAAIQMAMHPQAQLPPPPNPASINMQGLASIDWTGPIEPAVRKLAAASGYRVRALGVKPGIPVIVALNAKNTPIADILRDVSFQAVNKARIAVYPQSKIIELRYLSNAH